MTEFMIYVSGDGGEQGCWTVDKSLCEIFRQFMLALQTGNEDKMHWRGTTTLGAWMVRPRLLHTGDKKLAAIRVIRQVYGFNLKDAKHWTDCAPCELPEITWTQAKQLAEGFVRAQCGAIELPNILEQLAASL